MICSDYHSRNLSMAKLVCWSVVGLVSWEVVQVNLTYHTPQLCELVHISLTAGLSLQFAMQHSRCIPLMLHCPGFFQRVPIIRECIREAGLLTEAITQNSDSYCVGDSGHLDPDLNGYPTICNSLSTHN